MPIIALNIFSTTMGRCLISNIFLDPNITAEDKAELKRGELMSFETDYDFDLCGENLFNTGIRGRKYFVTKGANHAE